MDVSILDKWLLGLLGTAVVAMISYLFNRQTNTYTKEETDSKIRDVVAPVVAAIEQDRELSREERKENTTEMKSLNNAITDLRIELVRHKDV